MKYIPPLNSDQDTYVDGTDDTPGSVVPADVFNHVQREIVNAIIGAGLTPNENDLSQLSQAVNTLVEINAPEPASKTSLGVVQIGDYINVNADGLISLSKASTSTYGVIKIGKGLTLDSEGNLILANPPDVKDDSTLKNNVNNLKTTGTYFIHCTASTQNAPISGLAADWWIIVNTYDNHVLQQAIMHTVGTNNAASGVSHSLVRVGTGSTFSAWQYMYAQYAG